MEDEFLLNEIEEQNKQEKKEEEENIRNMIRKGFIAKVYGLLLIQLSLTFGFIVLSIEIKSLTFFLLDHFGLYIIISIIPFIILIAIVIKPQIMRKVPINYILLFIFSFSFGYTNVLFVLRFKKVNIYLSMLLTLIVVLSLTIYAYKTKEDFTLMGGIFFVFLILICFASIINIFLGIKILDLMIDIFSVFLFSLYIIYDTQIILGNKSLSLSEDDYILAVLNLYLDIINLFIHILKLVSFMNR